MPDRRIGVKAVVHHCVSKITLKRTINPRSGGSPKKAMNDYGRQFPFSVYKKPALVSLDHLFARKEANKATENLDVLSQGS